MASYRINQRNVYFHGSPGDVIQAEPGPFLDAAVRSGIITRTDRKKPSPITAAKPKKTKDKHEDKPGQED